jgi:hypothetical protein
LTPLTRIQEFGYAATETTSLPFAAAILRIVFVAPKCSSEQTMSDFTRALCASFLAAVLVSGAAFISASAAAPTLSEADDRAVKEAIASCKSEAKAKKIRFPASRTFLRNCVTETIRNNAAKR